MATSARRERRQRYQNEDYPYQYPPQPRKRRWLLRFGFLLAVLAILGWFLPAIVANTPILGWIAQRASSSLKLSISVQSASLGWLSPIALRGVAVRDRDNQAVVEAAEIASDKSLLAIVRDYTHLGQFRLEKPVISIVLREGGSNVEDMLAGFKSDTPENKSSASAAVDLVVVDGTVKITDEAAKQSWQLDKVNASLSMPADSSQAMTAKASAKINDARQPGNLAVEFSMKPGQDDKTKNTGDITASTENLPLAMAQSLVGRYLKQARLDGRLTCQVHALWGGEGAQGKTVVQADLAAEQFVFAAAALGNDRIDLPQVRAASRLTMTADRLDLEKTRLQCDLGSFAASGSINLGQKGKASALDWLSHNQYEVQGNVDLARLAAMLPGTLHIRKETQITSGQLEMALSSRPQADAQSGMAWRGRVTTGNLVASQSGRQFSWPNPIKITLDAHDTDQGPVVDNLQCDSDFLKIHASGTPDALTASLSMNLRELGDQLGRFVDLGGMQLAGDGFGNVNWRRDAQRQFSADAELQLHKLQVVLPDKQPWVEENLLLYCAAKGQTDGTVNTRIEAASLSIQAGEDRLTAQLLQPVADLKQGGIWPVRLGSQGKFQTWTARAATFLPLSDWQLAGTLDLDIQATGSKDGVNIGQAKIHATQFAMTSPYLNLDEPEMELTAVGSWNQGQSRLQLSPATLATTSVALKADSFVLAMPQNGPTELNGTVKYQGDLGRMAQWFADRTKPRTWAVGGQLLGSVEFKQSAGTIRYETAADVNNLMVADASGGQFQEPLVRLSARGDYETKTGQLRLEQAQIASSFVAAAVAGRLSQADKGDRPLSPADASPGYQADIAGQYSYDLDRVCGLLRPYIGPNIRFAGRGTSAAAWRGPLSLASGHASAALKWEAADVYGFQVGPGEIKPVLADGVLQIAPTELSVSRGTVFLAPKMRLSPQPMELTLPPGPLVRQVQINPRMCAFFLKYIAPVLADVASAQGSFSIDLDGCRIPLSDPAKGDFAGRFIIHSVEIGPGPLIRELAILMDREAPAKLRKEGIVPFRMVDGRIYHQDMELIFPDFTVRTSGSVGLDQTLKIMAEMPVPPKWLENNPAAAALRNQTIRLPIAGTLQKPQIDRSMMEQVSRQFIRNAARNLLEEGLNRGLDQLFQQPQQK
jgi:translocation and assembly module TamB